MPCLVHLRVDCCCRIRHHFHHLFLFLLLLVCQMMKFTQSLWFGVFIFSLYLCFCHSLPEQMQEFIDNGQRINKRAGSFGHFGRQILMPIDVRMRMFGPSYDKADEFPQNEYIYIDE